jgi:hypothetical protein
MDLLFIELVLWVGLLFLFWALKDIGRIESEIESLGILNHPLQPGGNKNYRHFSCPQQVSDPIGRYRDETIYRYATIDGESYQFDYVQPEGNRGIVHAEERCVSPGLVYVRCDRPAPLASG